MIHVFVIYQPYLIPYHNLNQYTNRCRVPSSFYFNIEMGIFFQFSKYVFNLMDVNDKNTNKEPVLEISLGNDENEQK